MATVVRPPFYVPRPSDDPVWSGTPLNYGAIALTFTQLKQFGQHGQAPTKNWNSIYTFDDAALWNWPPQGSDIIVQLTHQKVFGSGGQVREKRWALSYTYDDASVWNAAPDPSAIIGLLTHQSMFNAGGQVPAKQWRYDWDEASVWNAQPIQYPIIGYLTAQKFYGAGGQVPAKNWNSITTIDDASAWQFKALYNNNLASKPSPLIPGVWKYNNDDAAVWNSAPIDSPVIAYLTQQKVFGAGGQVPTKQWHYDTDDASVWSGNPIKDAILFPLLTAAGQVKNKPWLFGYDDPPSWPGQPTAVSAMQVSLTSVKFYGAGGQAPTRQWHYDNDDSAVWWNWLNRNLTANTAVGRPLTLPAQQFVLSSEEPWQLTYQRNLEASTVVLPPFKLRQARLDIDDASTWQWQFIKPIAPTAFTIRAALSFTFYDDAAAWAGGFKSIPMTLAGGKAPVSRMRPNFGLPDDQFWSPTLQAIVNKFLPVGRTSPFFSGKWGLDLPQDTPTTLSSRAATALIFFLKFLASPRFVTALTENRVVTPLESRTVSAPAEPRVITILESRVVTPSVEDRVVTAPPKT